jgi:hypothetical protein
MMSGSAPYHLVSHWRIQGRPAEIYQVLEDTADLARWWPAVYLSVKQVEPGDTNGIGATFDLQTRGWLPYTLRWQLRIVEKKRPRRIVLEAKGDLTGRGIWTITAEDPLVDVAFDWQVAAEKAFLRRWSWLLRPIFAANHRWAMARGEESLQRELAFRQAPPEKWETIPPPPRPSNISVAGLLVILGGGMLIFLAGLYLVVSFLVGLVAPG